MILWTVRLDVHGGDYEGYSIAAQGGVDTYE
jgi:hypothetical protein